VTERGEVVVVEAGGHASMEVGLEPPHDRMRQGGGVELGEEEVVGDGVEGLADVDGRPECRADSRTDR
jgi:hypothetical protein